MEIRSILVNLDIDSFDTALVNVATNLARRFDASVIGVAAAEPAVNFIGVQASIAQTSIYDDERTAIDTRLRAIETDFMSHLWSGLEARYHSFLESPNRSVLSLARMADLVLVGAHDTANDVHARNLDVGELVLAAGRPVLVAASGIKEIFAERVVVAWKDTREARRAIVDALPLLKGASEVLIATIEEGDLVAAKSSLNDVVAWAQRHGIKASGQAYTPRFAPMATLEEAARAIGADLVVAGAYGHSRMREWLFGGMTRDLLSARDISLLLSN